MTSWERYEVSFNFFVNEQNKSTSGQNTYQKHLNYEKIGSNFSFEISKNTVYKVDDFKLIIKDISGLKFICVKCGTNEEKPSPPLEILKVDKFNFE